MARESYPLAEVVSAVARRWYAPLAATLALAAVAGGISALRAPIYESSTVLRVEAVWVQPQALAVLAAEPARLLANRSQAGEIDRLAEAFVHNTGNRILRKDQTFEQYLTSYRINALAQAARGDRALRAVAEAGGDDLLASWPRARDDLSVLGREAMRVFRDKPESVVRFSVMARDAEAARRGARALGQTLLDIEADERGERLDALRKGAGDLVESATRSVSEWTSKTETARNATEAASARAGLDAARALFSSALECEQRLDSGRHLFATPAFARLVEASAPRRVAPRPLLAATRGAIAGFLVSLLLLAVFANTDAANERQRLAPDPRA